MAKLSMIVSSWNFQFYYFFDTYLTKRSQKQKTPDFVLVVFISVENGTLLQNDFFNFFLKIFSLIWIFIISTKKKANLRNISWVNCKLKVSYVSRIMQKYEKNSFRKIKKVKTLKLKKILVPLLYIEEISFKIKLQPGADFLGVRGTH